MSNSNFIKCFIYGLTSLKENDLTHLEVLSIFNGLNSLNTAFSNIEKKTDFFDVLRDIYTSSLNEIGKLPDNFKRVLSCNSILSNEKTSQFVCLATMVGSIPDILEMQEIYLDYAQRYYVDNPSSDADNDVNLISWKKPLFLHSDAQLSLIQNLASSILFFTKKDELKDVCDRFNNLFENGGFLAPDDIFKKDIEVQNVIKIDIEQVFRNLKEIDSNVEPVLLFNEVKKMIQEFIDVAMDMNIMDVKLNQDLNYLLNESFEKDYELTGIFNVPKHLYFYVAKKTYSPESVIKAIDNNLNNFVESYYDIKLNLSEPSQTLQRFKSIESLKKLYVERFKKDVLEASLSLVDVPHEDNKDWDTSFKI